MKNLGRDILLSKEEIEEKSKYDKAYSEWRKSANKEETMKEIKIEFCLGRNDIAVVYITFDINKYPDIKNSIAEIDGVERAWNEGKKRYSFQLQKGRLFEWDYIKAQVINTIKEMIGDVEVKEVGV